MLVLSPIGMLVLTAALILPIRLVSGHPIHSLLVAVGIVIAGEIVVVLSSFLLIVQFRRIAGYGALTDERQRALTDRAHRQAYIALKGVLMPIAIYAGAAQFASSGILSGRDLLLVAMAVSGVFLVLPYAIVLWSEPTLEELDEDLSVDPRNSQSMQAEYLEGKKEGGGMTMT